MGERHHAVTTRMFEPV